MESQPCKLTCTLPLHSSAQVELQQQAAGRVFRPNSQVCTLTSPTTPRGKRRRGSKMAKISNHDFVQSHGVEKLAGKKAIIKMSLQQDEQQTCNVLDLWSRAPRSPSRSVPLAPDLTRWAGTCKAPPLSPKSSEGRMSREAARETKRRLCSPRDRRPRKAARTNLQT